MASPTGDGPKNGRLLDKDLDKMGSCSQPRDVYSPSSARRSDTSDGPKGGVKLDKDLAGRGSSPKKYPA